VHGQTWALLRRRDVTLSVEDLERPSGDPREVAALRHNVRQLQREIDELTRPEPALAGLRRRLRRGTAR
jgi:hypothetical protein